MRVMKCIVYLCHFIENKRAPRAAEGKTITKSDNTKPPSWNQSQSKSCSQIDSNRDHGV